MKREGKKGTSIHWAGFDFPTASLVDAAMGLQRATNFAEFRQAVTNFGALDANWVYSDRDGNIGYQLGVPVPIREYQDTFAMHPAASTASSWKGYLPLEETPHALNPPQGWIASCNNQPVSTSYTHPLPGFYDPYRITRAAAILGSESKWTREKAEKMQLDLVSGRALRWKELCASGAEKLGEKALAEELRQWDGKMETRSKAAALFSLCWTSLTRPLFEDEFGTDWTRARSIQEQVLSGNGAKLVDDRRSAPVESKEDIAAAAMKQAIATAKGRTYGEISSLTVAHPLSSVKALDRWLRLSRGPVPLGGDPGSLDANFNSWDEKNGTFRSVIGPSMRFVIDWADPDTFTINAAFGQSGNPLSPHYDDFFLPSLGGERWTVPFTASRQKENEVSRLRLLP
jgi:penicillin amidase